MPSGNIFDRMAVEFEQRMGAPEGRTEKVVREHLSARYESVFQAIEKFNKILQYQASDMFVEYELTNTSAAKQTTMARVRVGFSGESETFAFTLSGDKIESRDNFLVVNSNNRQGSWEIQRADEFIDLLGAKIAKVLGVDLV